MFQYINIMWTAILRFRTVFLLILKETTNAMYQDTTIAMIDEIKATRRIKHLTDLMSDDAQNINTYIILN